MCRESGAEIRVARGTRQSLPLTVNWDFLLSLGVGHAPNLAHTQALERLFAHALRPHTELGSSARSIDATSVTMAGANGGVAARTSPIASNHSSVLVASFGKAFEAP